MEILSNEEWVLAMVSLNQLEFGKKAEKKEKDEIRERITTE